MSTMVNWRELEERIAAAVKLGRRPVAVTFLDAAPLNVEKFEGSEPSSCSFWRLAAGGKTFYTLPQDHFNCAVGAYTHNIALSPAREKETEQTLKFMFDLGYVKPEEVPEIPRLAKAPSSAGLCAAWRYADGAGCGAICVQAQRGDAAERSGESRAGSQRRASAG